MSRRDGTIAQHQHATKTGYDYGCRCEPCKQAARDYLRAWRSGLIPGKAAERGPRHRPAPEATPPIGGPCSGHVTTFDAACDRLSSAETTGINSRFMRTAEASPAVQAALTICRSCPFAVRDACLTFALASGDRHSVLGGLTPRQRHDLGRSAPR